MSKDKAGDKLLDNLLPDKLFKDLSELLSGYTTLFILEDMISDKLLCTRRSSLLEVVSFGRHRDNYLWFITQSYKCIPSDVRKQVKQLFIWYPKGCKEFREIQEENDVLKNEQIHLLRTS